MTKMYAKIDKFNDLMSYFTTRQWDFNDMNVRTLNKILSPEDRDLFPFDISELRWEPYIRNYMAGIRLHLLNEKPDNLVAARRKFFA
jgi:fatty acyl-CoA reductase